MLKLVTGGAIALACSIGIMLPANAAEAPSEVELVQVTPEGFKGGTF